MENCDTLESVVDANWAGYILAKRALEKLRALKGGDWPNYVTLRFAGLTDAYKPRIRQREEAKTETMWELTQRLAATERSLGVLEPLMSVAENIHTGSRWQGTPDQLNEYRRLKQRVRELNRKIQNYE